MNVVGWWNKCDVFCRPLLEADREDSFKILLPVLSTLSVPLFEVRDFFLSRFEEALVAFAAKKLIGENAIRFDALQPFDSEIGCGSYPGEVTDFYNPDQYSSLSPQAEGFFRALDLS